MSRTMRVIAGTAKGRRLRAGRGFALRPTADKVKGALFNILTSRASLEGITLLDLFAGSGALGIEALSRGAAAVTFVEQSSTSARVLCDNLRLCGFDARGRVLQVSVQRAIARLRREGVRFEGIVVDPPYGQGLAERTLAALAAADLVQPGGWVVLEHRLDESPAGSYGGLRLTQARRYGKTGLALFVAERDMPAGQ